MNTKVFVAFVGLVATIAVFAGSAWATPINLTNNSFQTTVLADGASTKTISGWTTQTGGDAHLLVYNPTSADFVGAAGNGTLPSPADGSQCMFNSYTYGNDLGFYTAFNSNPTFTLQAGTIYTLTVAVGRGLNDGGIYGGFDSGVDTVVRVGFYDKNKGQIDGTATLTVANAPAAGTFKDFTYTLNSNSVINGTNVKVGDPLAALIILQSQAYVDNVRVDMSPIPEPSTLTLLASGILGLLAYAWRKWK